MVKIVGILNITPDSFSDGGKFFKVNDALAHVEKLVSEGVDIIDVGGESSRPGSVIVSEDEEIRRVIPVIVEIKKRFPKIPVSIDTYKPNVASRAIDNGAEIVNDIYGMRWFHSFRDDACSCRQNENKMADVVAQKNVSVIIMHMKGTPLNMQKKAEYKDVISEIYEFFDERIKFAKSKGIKEKKIILDPGIGFGKTLQHNLLIMKNLQKFKKLGLPVMVGASRKSFINELLKVDHVGCGVFCQNISNIADRQDGTIAASLYCVLNGADYLRVHDVLSMKRAITVFEAIRGQNLTTKLRTED